MWRKGAQGWRSLCAHMSQNLVGESLAQGWRNRQRKPKEEDGGGGGGNDGDYDDDEIIIIITIIMPIIIVFLTCGDGERLAKGWRQRFVYFLARRRQHQQSWEHLG